MIDLENVKKDCVPVQSTTIARISRALSDKWLLLLKQWITITIEYVDFDRGISIVILGKRHSSQRLLSILVA